jgi:hypothetical protein
LFFGNSNPHGPNKIELKHPLIVILLLPLVFFLDLTCSFLSFGISSLDFLDRKRRFTLGYALRANSK